MNFILWTRIKFTSWKNGRNLQNRKLMGVQDCQGNKIHKPFHWIIRFFPKGPKSHNLMTNCEIYNVTDDRDKQKHPAKKLQNIECFSFRECKGKKSAILHIKSTQTAMLIVTLRIVLISPGSSSSRPFTS